MPDSELPSEELSSSELSPEPSGRLLREFIPFHDGPPTPFRPKPPPDDNPYRTISHVLKQLHDLAERARFDGEDCTDLSNEVTSPWDKAEAEARANSHSRGIPFGTFDPVLVHAKELIRGLSAIAWGSKGKPIGSLREFWAFLDRLSEVAKSYSPTAEAKSPDGKLKLPLQKHSKLAEFAQAVRQLEEELGDSFFALTYRKAAGMVGCSTGQLRKIDRWQEKRREAEESGKAKARKKGKTLSLDGPLDEAPCIEDIELQRLTGESYKGRTRRSV